LFRRHVGDVVGKSRFGFDVAETVANLPALEDLFDFLEQRTVGAMHTADRYIVLLEQIAGLVDDGIGETNNPVAGNGRRHEFPVGELAARQPAIRPYRRADSNPAHQRPVSIEIIMHA